MNDQRDQFIASEYARVLDVSAQRVRQVLGSSLGGTIRVKGQDAAAWPVAALPMAWRDQLTRRVKAGGYLSIEHLLSDPVARWEPAVALDKISASCVEAARERCAILAPILAIHHDKPTAEILRLAAPRFVCSSRTLRRIIDRAKDRDCGLIEFDRWEIFLDENPQSIVAAELELPTLSFEGWEDACHWLQTSLGAGAKSPSARRRVLKALIQSQFTRGKSRGAIQRSFQRKYSQWLDKGNLAPERNGKCGRPLKFALTKQESDRLRLLHLQKESLPLAIERFARDPICRHETKELINVELDRAARERRLPNWPLSLRSAAYVSAELQAQFRGKKHAQKFEVIGRRGNWWEDKGTKYPLLPNSLFESDDSSVNQPFQYTDPETGKLQLGRQALFTQDVFSAAWLGVSPIGRERDAYRIEDQADHISDTVLAHGLPLAWRFERGPWENKFIDGVKLSDGSRWGGLDALFHVFHCFKPRAKGLIESSFNLLQSLMAHESTTIGRSRGEFETATKLFLSGGKGNDRAAAHFWDIARAAEGLRSAMNCFNERPKKRRAHGRETTAPADLRRGVVPRLCPEKEMWRFLPIKRAATIRGGCIECSVEHYPMPFRFRVNGEGPYLERGYSVLIAFHPGRPEEGCHVFNADRSERNRDRIPFGEPLLLAPMAPDAPQFSLQPDQRQFVARKNANAAVRSEFRAIAATGKTGRSVSTGRDGWGNSVSRSNNGETKMAAVSLNERTGEKLMKTAIDEAAEEARLTARADKLEAEAIARGDVWVA